MQSTAPSPQARGKKKTKKKKEKKKSGFRHVSPVRPDPEGKTVSQAVN